jgi:MFS family permease
MNPTQIGLVSSIMTLGGLIGALCTGPVSAKYGRLLAMRYTTIAFVIGPIAEAIAPNIPVLVIGRFISGLGAGAALVVVPIYISEIAPPKQKGFFGSFTQIMTNLGILFTQLFGYFLSYGHMWRIILAIGGVIGLIQLIGLIFAVDSPKWRADHGQSLGAKADLRRIRGHKVDISDEISGWTKHNKNTQDGKLVGIHRCSSYGLISDLEEQQTLLSDNDPTSHRSGEDRTTHEIKQEVLGIFSVLRHPHYSRATLTVMVVLTGQQLCGINSIVMYGVSLLSDLLKANSALLNILVSLLNVLVTTGCAPLVDIWGRKPCLMGSVAGMGTSSILLAIGIRGGLPTMSAVAVLLFVASFGLGLGPVPWILSSELVGPEAVSATQTWALVASWIATFLVAQFVPILNESLGKGFIYFIFAGISAVFFAFIAWFVPETMGKKDAEEVWGRERRED